MLTIIVSNPPIKIAPPFNPILFEKMDEIMDEIIERTVMQQMTDF